ncbi:SusC/RagA family TonB-linked outer membrane protein [Wenyingzhuangia gilva]|nr:TonB-dependent receptor [Wenyingzhuangia sp. chi5]
MFFAVITTFQLQAKDLKSDNVADEIQKRTITGVVKDEKGLVLPGATVQIEGTSNISMTDFDGEFKLNINEADKVLVVSYLGFDTAKVKIGSKSVFNIILNPSSESLEELVLVGFGTQKKESLVSSITTVSPKEIKGPSSNLTTMMAGRVAGMIAFQRSGEPGADNSDFFIRGLGTFGSGKQDPLILIDGIESTNTDMARLQPDDIDSFSVLKDASAAAIYGARGANGVVLISTKSGTSGKLKFRFRAENKFSTNSRNFDFADNITYMNLANEAVLTRNATGNPPYTRTKIDRTIAGDNPYLYPNNNWIDQLIKDVTVNQGYNLSINGGGEKAQYYVAGTYNVDNGVLKVDGLNNFNSNIKLRNYSFRTNVNLNLTPTTEGIIRMYAQFDDYNGPVGGGAAIFNKALWSNPVAFPARYPKEYLPYVDHPLFGGAVTGNGSTTLLQNPYADMVKGYQVNKTSSINAQIELKQDLSFITPGLKADFMGYVKRYSRYSVSRQYNPFYYSAFIDPSTQKIQLSPLNAGGLGSLDPQGREYLNYAEGAKELNSRTHFQGSLTYNKTFADKHAFSAMLITILQNFEQGNPGSVQSSLPSRNLGLSGRMTYAYEGKYLAELNFGYNGSERFAKNNRFGFFPALALGYVISKESFFEPLKESITSLKLRASYGLLGNDQIGNDNDRFFYLSEVNLDNGTYGSTFGELGADYSPGLSISRYANGKISWEQSEIINLGFDLELFKSFTLIADFFKQTRTNILQDRANIGSTLGLAVIPSTNFGKAESKGMDMSVVYNKNFGGSWWANLRGNFTYSTSKILTYDENYYPDELSYLYRKGRPTTQQFGYIAERLFVDDAEVANSPRQFGEVRGGDIKYRDVNGDGVITSLDRVPMGYPTVPEIVYGFGGTVGYKNFDFSMFFQGSARSSFFINPQNISPFVINGGSQNGLLNVIANDHWSEENRNSYAFWPRLSDTFIENNNQSSTWWMRDGAFLRLKSVELAYNVPNKFLDNYSITSLRLYANTTNPVVFSKFKLWDPEMGGNGLGYPIQSTYNIGILLNL